VSAVTPSWAGDVSPEVVLVTGVSGGVGEEGVGLGDERGEDVDA
jgi:hypothetical protein